MRVAIKYDHKWYTMNNFELNRPGIRSGVTHEQVNTLVIDL